MAAQLDSWQYKSSEKTAQGTLDELRALVDHSDQEHQCVWKAIQCASVVKGGKESVANGLVAIVVEEYDTLKFADFLREHAFVACHLEVTADSVENGAVVDADINLGARVLDLYHAAGDPDALISRLMREQRLYELICDSIITLFGAQLVHDAWSRAGWGRGGDDACGARGRNERGNEQAMAAVGRLGGRAQTEVLM